MTPARRRTTAGSALPGRSRGGTGGRSSPVDCGVRLIFEGFTSRPGVRRGSPSRSGHGRPDPAAHSRRREPRAAVVGLPVARARPGSVPVALFGRGSVKGGGLPEESGKLACAGDHDDTGVLAAAVVQVHPALVKAPLGTPGDLHHPRVLAPLAPGERFADARLVAVMVCGLDQQAAGVAGAGLGDRALATLLAGGALGGHDAEKARQQAGLSKPPEVADLGGKPGGRERVDPAKAASRSNGWRPRRW